MKLAILYFGVLLYTPWWSWINYSHWGFNWMTFERLNMHTMTRLSVKTTVTHSRQQPAWETNAVSIVTSPGRWPYYLKQTTISSSNNSCKNWPHRARAWLVTKNFPNFCPLSDLGSTRESQLCIPNQSHKMPFFELVHLCFPLPAASYQGKSGSHLFLIIKLFHSSVCLWGSLKNRGAAGWLCFYSKLWINNFWLVSFGWSYCISTFLMTLWYLDSKKSK